MSTIAEQLAQVSESISRARTEKARLETAIAESRASAAAWQDKIHRQGMSPDAAAALAAHANAITDHQSRISRLNIEIDSLEKQYQQLQSDQAKFNARLADAAGKGLTGQDAVNYTKAKGYVYIAIGIALALAILAIVWAKYLRK